MSDLRLGELKEVCQLGWGQALLGLLKPEAQGQAQSAKSLTTDSASSPKSLIPFDSLGSSENQGLHGAPLIQLPGAPG